MTSVSSPSLSSLSGHDALEKLRNTRKEAFIKLTRMHLLFNIDCAGESLSALFQDEESQTKKENSLTDEMVARMNKLIAFIGREQNLLEEGIFRRCGSIVRQQELKSKLIHRFPVDFDAGQYNVHDCTNVLKTFLSELPEPLLSDKFFKINCEIHGNSERNENQIVSPSKKTKKLKKLQLLLLLLPPHVLSFVRDLLKLLHEASLHCETNKMDARNFATLFAPHLLFPRTLKACEMQQHLVILTDELEFMIDNVDTIFDPPKELLLDAKRELQKAPESKQDDDDVVDTVLTFCNRDNIPKESETAKHLAELYAYISNMPETPKKKSLIKHFNRQNGGITPLSLKKEEPSVKDRANNVMKAFRKGIQKRLNFLPGGKTPTKIDISKNCDDQDEDCALIRRESRCSWNSEKDLKEQNVKTKSRDEISNLDDYDEKTNILPSKNSKKPKV